MGHIGQIINLNLRHELKRTQKEDFLSCIDKYVFTIDWLYRFYS